MKPLGVPFGSRQSAFMTFRCHLLLCLKTRMVEPDRRAPSTRDAWFSSSLRMRQPCENKTHHAVLCCLGFNLSPTTKSNATIPSLQWCLHNTPGFHKSQLYCWATASRRDDFNLCNKGVFFLSDYTDMTVLCLLRIKALHHLWTSSIRWMPV